MHSLTLFGLAVLAVVVLAAMGGWATSGTTRLGREVGFVFGLLAGLAVALAVLPYVSGLAAALLVLLGATLGGAAVGAAMVGRVGLAVAVGLHRARLGSVDRLLGAALSALGALVICAILLHVAALLDPASHLVRAARQDAVGHWLIGNRVIVWL